MRIYTLKVSYHPEYTRFRTNVGSRYIYDGSFSRKVTINLTQKDLGGPLFQGLEMSIHAVLC